MRCVADRAPVTHEGGRDETNAQSRLAGDGQAAQNEQNQGGALAAVRARAREGGFELLRRACPVEMEKFAAGVLSIKSKLAQWSAISPRSTKTIATTQRPCRRRTCKACGISHVRRYKPYIRRAQACSPTACTHLGLLNDFRVAVWERGRTASAVPHHETIIPQVGRLKRSEQPYKYPPLTIFTTNRDQREKCMY